jgi:DNA-binding transcriptional MerR regulator
MNERGALPPKLYFRIGEVANLVGVEPHVLRYWEREFRSIRPTKSAKGQRVYSHRNVENLMRVRDLLYTQGFTIAGARKRLRETDIPEAPATDPDLAADSERAVAEAVAVPASAPATAAVAVATAFCLAPAAIGLRPGMRLELEGLRAEVEAFLQELSAEPQPD